jgi:hypothetical protein
LYTYKSPLLPVAEALPRVVCDSHRGLIYEFAMDRSSPVGLSQIFPWASALAIVQSSTFIRWHRARFRLFWCWKSRPVGRPPPPKNLRSLILKMADENSSWGEGRIADELSLKLGLLRGFPNRWQISQAI